MLNPFVCGTFHHEEDEPCPENPGSSPRKSKRKDSRNNNPYSMRGLDKFSELLADLDEKRQKIYSQMSPHDISFVRFVYSNTDDFVPIVVKVKNKDQKHKSEELKVRRSTPTSEPMDKSATESTAVEESQQPKLESNKKAAKKRFSWNMNKWDMWRPSFYLPVVIISILVFLIVFGRSVATLCTCIVWYIIPTLKDSSNPRKSVKKKDYVRGLSEKKTGTDGTKKKDYVRGLSEKKIVTDGTKKKDYVRGLSEKKMVTEGKKKKDYVRGWSEKKLATDGLLSPTSGNSEASKDKSIGKHGHKKSW